MNLFQKFKAFYAPYHVRVQYFIQNKMFKKRYLGGGFLLLYMGMFAISMQQYPKETTLMISKGVYKLSEIEIPRFARNLIFGTYSNWYNVNREQMIQNFQQYKCFSQFFTRKIKPRQISKQQSVIVSPSDSKILSYGQITQDSVFVVKGYQYSLGHLFCGQDIAFTNQEIQNLKKNKQNKLYHVVLYLAPGDYHRFHSSTNFQIVRRKAIQGALYSVKQKSLIKRKKVYQSNSRLILHGKWKQGYFGMVLVGALNVGRIIVKQKLNYQRGQQIGYFNLGSTIVLIFQSPSFQWKIPQNQQIKYGQILVSYTNKDSKKG